MKTEYQFFNKPLTARIIQAAMRKEGNSLRRMKKYLARSFNRLEKVALCDMGEYDKAGCNSIITLK